MFTKIEKNVVQSTDGYILKYDRRSLTYQEDEHHILQLGIEYLVDPFCMLIYAEKNMNYWNNLKEEIPQNKKQKIIVNIKAALDFLKIKYEIE